MSDGLTGRTLAKKIKKAALAWYAKSERLISSKRPIPQRTALPRLCLLEPAIEKHQEGTARELLVVGTKPSVVLACTSRRRDRSKAILGLGVAVEPKPQLGGAKFR